MTAKGADAELAQLVGEMGHLDAVALAESDPPFDYVLQFADVARPGVGLKQGQGLLAEIPDLLTHERSGTA